MNAIARIGLGATLGLTALACSGGSLGSAGTGGTGGVLTGDGPGNGGGAATRVSARRWSCRVACGICWRRVLRRGTCPQEPLGPEAFEACFETGVRASSGYMMSFEAVPLGDLYVHVRKPDGSLCYRYEAYIPASPSCEVTQHTWKDAAGNVVATGTSGSSPNWTTGITCAASGETAICGEPNPLRCVAVVASRDLVAPPARLVFRQLPGGALSGCHGPRRDGRRHRRRGRRDGRRHGGRRRRRPWRHGRRDGRRWRR